MRLLANACFIADEEDAVNEAVLAAVLLVSEKIMALFWKQYGDGSLFLKDNFGESIRLSHHRCQLVTDIFVRKFPKFCVEYFDFAVQLHKKQIEVPALLTFDFNANSGEGQWREKQTRKDQDLRSVTVDNIHALLSSSASTLTIHSASVGNGIELIEYTN